MRLFLLPISTRRTLLYCERKPNQSVTSQSYLSRITNKANVTWVAWEKAESGWKKQVTVYGNKMLDRIPYQEWGLKTIPALPSHMRRELQDASGKVGGEKVDVVFPALYLKEGRIRSILDKLASERQGLHRKRMIWSIVAMPFSAPFMLIPIIPNLPFFYLVFRAYSHWKALRGSQHLSHILNHNLLRPHPSPLLDQLYTAGLMHPTRALSRAAPYPTAAQMHAVANTIEKQTNGGDEDVMVLQRWNGKLIAERFELPDMEVEIERAVGQVESGIKATEELREEKEELESVAKAARPGGEQTTSASAGGGAGGGGKGATTTGSEKAVLNSSGAKTATGPRGGNTTIKSQGNIGSKPPIVKAPPPPSAKQQPAKPQPKMKQR
jgi:hypothetical protein